MQWLEDAPYYSHTSVRVGLAYHKGDRVRSTFFAKIQVVCFGTILLVLSIDS